MKITKKWLKSKNACEEAYNYFEEHENEAATDRQVIEGAMLISKFDWANWVIVRLMDKKQKVQYAIFAAELVLSIYEKHAPDNKAPRKAIESAKAYLKRPCKQTEKEAADAAYAAYAAADAAYAAYAAAYAADAAAYAAYAAADAAYAADAAADAAAYAADAAAYAADAADAKKEIQTKIIEHGIKLAGIK